MRYIYRLSEYNTVCLINDWAELSICKRPTGRSTCEHDIVNYIYDLYGSKTPFPRFIKLNLTISLLVHCLFDVIGSSFHYLNTFGNPFGKILGYDIYGGSLVYIILIYWLLLLIYKSIICHPLLTLI